ncbi:MAG: hypothetical protein JWO78_1794 [Micavibrio sp.]|nr:hypothetical protein [Micavibrio sp.]
MTISRYHHRNRSGEKGNILFYILIAIVAFAALSFAVTQSSRESASTIDAGKVDLATTEILDYVTALRGAVQTMTIQGVKQNQVCFDQILFSSTYYHAACNTAKNRVFYNYGGNAPAPHLVAQDALQRSLSGSADYGLWDFPNNIQVKGVGQDCPSDASCNDLVVLLEPLNDLVCKNVNRKMGVDVPDTIPGNLTPVTTTPYTGSFFTGSVIDAPNLNGKRTGCFKNNNGHNVFYAVLVGN